MVNENRYKWKCYFGFLTLKTDHAEDNKHA